MLRSLIDLPCGDPDTFYKRNNFPKFYAPYEGRGRELVGSAP